MKRVLIISENDAAGHRLNLLYQSLFLHDKKELYWCSIDIIDCRQESTLFPHKLKVLESNSQLIHSIDPYRTTLTQPTKNFRADTCQDINEIIKKSNIDTVLIPNFIYDGHRRQQYETIVKDILRNSKVEIIGLYI